MTSTRFLSFSLWLPWIYLTGEFPTSLVLILTSESVAIESPLHLQIELVPKPERGCPLLAAKSTALMQPLLSGVGFRSQRSDVLAAEPTFWTKTSLGDKASWGFTGTDRRVSTSMTTGLLMTIEYALLIGLLMCEHIDLCSSIWGCRQEYGSSTLLHRLHVAKPRINNRKLQRSNLVYKWSCLP